MYNNNILSSQGFTGESEPYVSQEQPNTTMLDSNQNQNPPFQEKTQSTFSSSEQVHEQSSLSSLKETKSTIGKCCKTNFMKYVVLSSVYFIGIILMGMVGILGPWLMISRNVSQMVPYFIFCIYCFAFGLLLMIFELRKKTLIKLFPFLTSYNHRVLFIMFLGTLAMCSYDILKELRWVGYVAGGTVMGVGVIHFVVGCSNPTWRKSQNSKYYKGWNDTPPLQQQQQQQNILSQDQSGEGAALSGQQYSPLTINNNTQNPQQQPLSLNEQSQPQQTNQFIPSGPPQERQQTQILSSQNNTVVGEATLNAFSNSASQTISNAYDNFFE